MGWNEIAEDTCMWLSRATPLWSSLLGPQLAVAQLLTVLPAGPWAVLLPLSPLPNDPSRAVIIQRVEPDRNRFKSTHHTSELYGWRQATRTGPQISFMLSALPRGAAWSRYGNTLSSALCSGALWTMLFRGGGQGCKMLKVDLAQVLVSAREKVGRHPTLPKSLLCFALLCFLS